MRRLMSIQARLGIILVVFMSVLPAVLFSQEQPAGAPVPAVDSKKEKQLPEGEIKELTPSSPIMEIRKLDSERPLYSIELRDVPLADLFRVIAHDYNLNIMLEPGVNGTVTASFTNISMDEALDSLAEISGLSVERKGRIIRIKPNILSKNFILKHVEAKKLLESTGLPLEGTQSNVYSLLSKKGKILLGRHQNSVIVMDYPENVKKIEEYLTAVDHKMTSKVFKLKYLKANEVLGGTQKTVTTTETSTAGGTTTSTTLTQTSPNAGGNPAAPTQ